MTTSHSSYKQPRSVMGGSETVGTTNNPASQPTNWEPGRQLVGNKKVNENKQTKNPDKQRNKQSGKSTHKLGAW